MDELLIDAVNLCNMYAFPTVNLCNCKPLILIICVSYTTTPVVIEIILFLPRGGNFNDLYPDVCVKGLEKDPF